MGYLFGWLRFLIPPLHANESIELYRWRMAMSGTLMGLTLIVVLHVALAMGLVGNLGYANADNVDEVRKDLKIAAIMDRHRDFCHAPMPSDARAYYLQRRNKLIQEYEVIAGDKFNVAILPDCAQL